MAGALALAASGPGEDAWKEGIRHFSAEDFRRRRKHSNEPSSRIRELDLLALVGLGHGRRAERMTALRMLAAAPLVRRMRREVERSIELDQTNLDAHDTLQSFIC